MPCLLFSGVRSFASLLFGLVNDNEQYVTIQEYTRVVIEPDLVDIELGC